MVISTASNTITSCTDMNSNAELEELLKEQILAGAVPQGEMTSDDMLVMGLVRGITESGWQEFCACHPKSQWCAMPVRGMCVAGPGANSGTGQQAEIAKCARALVTTAREATRPAKLGTLSNDLFMCKLNRELLRLRRGVGDLSLISTAIQERKRLCVAIGEKTTERLEHLLAETMLAKLEACDCLSVLTPGHFTAILSNMGQIKARYLADSVQETFVSLARPYLPVGGISAGQSVKCAVGLVCISQDTQGSAAELLARVDSALARALKQKDGHIQQESPSILAQATLVNSNEKRFLFFGGDES